VAKNAFIVAFTVLAMIFVPVDIYYFMGNLIAPCCYLILAGLMAGVWDVGWIIFGGIYLGLYVGLFYSGARL